MAVTWDRVLALLIAIGWAVAAGVAEASLATGLTTLALFLAPVGLIWFADDIGRGPRDSRPKLTILGFYQRYQGGGTGAERPSPPGLLVVMGWFLLVGLPVLILLLTRWAANLTY